MMENPCMIDGVPIHPIDILKEIDWFFQNRSGTILPFWYEDELIDMVHEAAQSGWTAAQKHYERLMLAHLEAFSDES